MRQGIRRVRQILFFFCEDINKILKSYPFCILYCIKLANDKYTPSINGMINPITKAPTVGIRKNGQYFLTDFPYAPPIMFYKTFSKRFYIRLKMFLILFFGKLGQAGHLPVLLLTSRSINKLLII